MDIRNRKELKAFAAQRLADRDGARQVTVLYAALLLGMAAAVTGVNYLLQRQISQSGGLGNLGLRSMLSTVQTVLPVVQAVLGLFLELGYLAAMLRIARGQYVSHRTLRLGFDRGKALLTLTLLRGLMTLGVVIACVYLATMIFMMTPLSGELMSVLLPLVQDASVTTGDILADEALYAQLTTAMEPLILLSGALCLPALALVLLPYRLADYVIVDRPGLGALAAMGQSRRMLRGSKWALVKLDVSFWWYYAALALASAVCYGDVLLPALGFHLPWSAEAAYGIFYVLYLVVQFGIYLFLMPRVETTYALAYDTLNPPEPQKGAVLGNIFQM